MLVHFRSIELGFLKRAFKRHGFRWSSPKVVDTVDLLRRRARLRNPEASQETMTLNLSEARKEFGLPAYQAHDALTDAVATGELFLTLRRALGAQTVRDVVS
jgi:DNA polymerase-3 subunit epsilon